MNHERLIYLINGWLQEQLSRAELAELDELLQQPAAQEAAGDYLQLQLSTGACDYAPDLTIFNERLMQKLHPPVRRLKLLRYAAAAVLVLAMVATWLLVNRQPAKAPLAKIVNVPAPAVNRASIQLADGRTIFLDSARNGRLAVLEGVQLVKLADGQISYEGNTGTVSYNTITNPRGSKVIDMALSDGSHVWLNAGSSMRYPVSMKAGARDVTVDGEAYFEVAKDVGRPFTVSNGQTKVTVLGTHFNVKAYANEPSLKITLLEGLVRVRQVNQVQLLRPNQQAVVSGGAIALIADADMEEALAWKNGKTSFHGTDIAGALRELERWYDIGFEIRGTLPARSLNSDIDRNEPLKDVLKSLLEDNNIAYEFDQPGRKLIVLRGGAAAGQ